MSEVDQNDKAGYTEPTSKDQSESMVERMAGIRKRFQRAVDAESDLREDALDDFRFAWIQGEQWDDNLANRRGSRPRYEFNKLGQAIKQVINSNRQNTPSIKVRANKESTRDLADIRQGLIRNIESQSNADSVYDWGALYAITSGFGAWRISARYADDESFDQDLFIERIQNPLTSVWFGPSKELDRRDAPYAFLIEDITWAEYRSRWPKAEFSSFDPMTYSDSMKGWCSEKFCRIAEYFYKVSEDEEILQLSDGRVVKADEFDEKAAATPAQSNPQSPLMLQGQPVQAQPPVTVVNRRTVKVEKIKSEIVSGREVLEGPFDWPGKFIPIVPCWGNLVNDEGKDVWFGMVRWSKDAQRLYNYNRSNSVEVLANQARAPFLYTPKQVEGFEREWGGMAVNNAPGLPFNPDPLVSGGAPIRQPPPQFPAALIEASQADDEDIKATTGIYAANLGQPSNETSGRAIQARQQQGNTATYDYSDNVAKAIAYTGEIINDLIPYYYDTYRELRILGSDGAEKYVEVNKPVYNPDTQQWEKVNDLTQGKYDVSVTIGPSFATQRMETMDAMLQLAQAGGPPAMLFQYGALKNMDVPGMDEVEQALRNMLVGMHILQPDQQEQAQMAQQQAPPPNPIDIAKTQESQAAAARNAAQAQKFQAETQRILATTPSEVAKNTASAAHSEAKVAETPMDIALKHAITAQQIQMINPAILQQMQQGGSPLPTNQPPVPG